MLVAKGFRGSWFAEVGGERIPCVHNYWLKDGRYEDLGCEPGVGKWPKFIEAIKRDNRVLLTVSVPTPNKSKSGVSLARKGYLAVLDVHEVEADERSLRFKVKG